MIWKLKKTKQLFSFYAPLHSTATFHCWKWPKVTKIKSLSRSDLEISFHPCSFSLCLPISFSCRKAKGNLNWFETQGRKVENLITRHLIASFCRFSTRLCGTVTFCLGLIWTNLYSSGKKWVHFHLLAKNVSTKPSTAQWLNIQFWSQWLVHWSPSAWGELAVLFWPTTNLLSVERSSSRSCTPLQILHWNGNKSF